MKRGEHKHYFTIYKYVYTPYVQQTQLALAIIFVFDKHKANSL